MFTIEVIMISLFINFRSNVNTEFRVYNDTKSLVVLLSPHSSQDRRLGEFIELFL